MEEAVESPTGETKAIVSDERVPVTQSGGQGRKEGLGLLQPKHFEWPHALWGPRHRMVPVISLPNTHQSHPPSCGALTTWLLSSRPRRLRPTHILPCILPRTGTPVAAYGVFSVPVNSVCSYGSDPVSGHLTGVFHSLEQQREESVEVTAQAH